MSEQRLQHPEEQEPEEREADVWPTLDDCGVDGGADTGGGSGPDTGLPGPLGGDFATRSPLYGKDKGKQPR